MDWDRREVPEAVLQERVAQVATACGEQGYDALLIYCGYTRPAQVSALTHFVPFWSQGLLAVVPSGKTALIIATTGRTVQWIRSTSRVDDVVPCPEVGAKAGEWLREHTSARRIAIASFDDVPASALANLRRALPDAVIDPAGDWYTALDASFGPTPEVNRQAREIAASAMALISAGSNDDANALVAALDQHCRAQGAEEVAVYVSPDLSKAAQLSRIEGPMSLGQYFGVQITLAYKGYWLRTGSSFIRGHADIVEHPGCADALRALRAASGRSRDIGELVAAIEQASGASVSDWTLEARRDGLPLSPVGTAGGPRPDTAPATSTLSACLRSGNDTWTIATPL